MSEKLVRAYYSEFGVKEWKRLVKDPYSRLELDTTLRFLKKHLPKNGLVLDAGGGPGRYTIELAKSGYNVILLDLTSELLNIASRQIRRAKVQDKVRQVIQGSVVDLSMFGSKSFDAVVCLGGALSHIVNRNRRDRAIDELVRVAKKNAPVFVSVIGRLALFVAGLVQFPDEMEIKRLYLDISETGNYRGGYGFAPCHFYLPEELKNCFRKRRMEVLEMVGLEGLATLHRKKTNRLWKKYPEGWKNWQAIHSKTCTHPSVVGISEHFMIVCRKK